MVNGDDAPNNHLDSSNMTFNHVLYISLYLFLTDGLDLEYKVFNTPFIFFFTTLTCQTLVTTDLETSGAPIAAP